MSATAASSYSSIVPPRRESLGTNVSLARVIHSEWTKLWSLRSTRWSLGLAFVAMAGLGPLIAALSMARWNSFSLQQRLTFDPIDRSLGGYHLAQLAIGILGVMVISGEYTTGQIRSSLLAAPTRLPVLWAKMLVFGSVSFVLMLVAAFIGFYSSQAILVDHHVNVSLSSPAAFRVLIGSVLWMTVTGVLCTALGTIVRRTAGGISFYVGLLFVLPGVAEILPASLANPIHKWIPSNAGTAVATVAAGPHNFAPWTGFAVYCGYTVVAVVIAAYLLKRRDA